MKHLINLQNGEVLKASDIEASKLVNTGKYQYISKSEFKVKPDYMGGNISKWYPVKSSNINSIQYLKDRKVLRIKFGQPRPNSQYSYKNVPEELFIGMIQADSKGHYFWEFIRNYPDLYPYTREW